MKQKREPYSPHLAEEPNVKQSLRVPQSPPGQQAMGFVFYKQTVKKKFRLKHILRGRKIETRQWGMLHIPKSFFCKLTHGVCFSLVTYLSLSSSEKGKSPGCFPSAKFCGWGRREREGRRVL